MSADRDGSVEELLDKAKLRACRLEPWPHYFESKAREFRIIREFFNLNGKSRILEIGCGNGFTSGLLAGFSEKVIAFDLPYKNPARHSIGIEPARELISTLDIRNVEVIVGCVERLPFGDESFDVIFSEYMLQYVPDKAKALGEMRRVLKRNGVIITVVPNFVARLYAPFLQYKYVMGRILYRLINKLKGRAGLTNKALPAADTGRKGSKHLLDHFLLRPDGSYKSFMEELISQTPAAWRRLFKQNQLRVVTVFSTEVLPLVLFDVISPYASRFIAKRSYRLNKWLGRMPVVKGFGYSFGIVAKK